MMIRKILKLVLWAGGAVSVLFGLLACDPEHRRKCEWYLVPEPKLKADPGFIPVCARNYETNRQHCKLQAKFDFVKKNYQRKFRLVDMDADTSGRFPRTITNIKYCQ